MPLCLSWLLRGMVKIVVVLIVTAVSSSTTYVSPPASGIMKPPNSCKDYTRKDLPLLSPLPVIIMLKTLQFPPLQLHFQVFGGGEEEEEVEGKIEEEKKKEEEEQKEGTLGCFSLICYRNLSLAVHLGQCNTNTTTTTATVVESSIIPGHNCTQPREDMAVIVHSSGSWLTVKINGREDLKYELKLNFPVILGINVTQTDNARLQFPAAYFHTQSNCVIGTMTGGGGACSREKQQVTLTQGDKLYIKAREEKNDIDLQDPCTHSDKLKKDVFFDTDFSQEWEVMTAFIEYRREIVKYYNLKFGENTHRKGLLSDYKSNNCRVESIIVFLMMDYSLNCDPNYKVKPMKEPESKPTTSLTIARLTTMLAVVLVLLVWSVLLVVLVLIRGNLMAKCD